MKFFVVLAAIVLAINAASDQELWSQFKQKYEREYRNLREEQKRFSIFQDNLRIIEAHNKKYESGEKTWYMGVNQFTDRTSEEFRAMLNASAAARPVSKEPIVSYKPSGLQAPESVNWVSQGVVTEVKNQGDCGSCWSFSATGGIEGQLAIKTGSLVSLSEQNLMDCCSVNAGCNGGWIQAAFDYVTDYGIETESDYPYKAVQETCNFESSKSVTKVSGFVNLDASEDVLLDAVANIGPISLAVNANWYDNYAGGILDEAECTSSDLNHGVLAVGYGTQNGVDYWLVKNSWSADWGESGYIKHIRNKNNQCGVASGATYPTM